MKFAPYVGITGFMDSSEVKALLQKIDPGLFATHKLMVGALASSKTLAGQTNSWPGLFPKVEDIGSIFIDSPYTCNLIHYSTDTPENLVVELENLIRYGGPNLTGFQLNIPWLELTLLKTFREKYPHYRIVLQVGKKMLKDTELNVDNTVTRLKPYIVEGAVDDILLDPSGGFGEFSLEQIVFAGKLFLKLLLDDFIPDEVGFGYAGGLMPERLHLLRDLVEDFTDMSIDVQAGVRSPRNQIRIWPMPILLVLYLCFTLEFSPHQMLDGVFKTLLTRLVFKPII